jgi:hypothetical protein
MPSKPSKPSKAATVGKAVLGAVTAPARGTVGLTRKALKGTSAPEPPPMGKYRGKTSATRG